MILVGVILVSIILYCIISDWNFMEGDLSRIRRVNMYQKTIVAQWVALAFVIIAWLIASFKWQSFIFYPGESKAPNNEFLAGFLTSVIITSIVLVIVWTVLSKKGKAPTVGNIDFLLPQTKQERIWYTFVALTAGICEELIFRGAMTFFLVSLPFDLSLTSVGVIGSIIFGLVHLYQGPKGVIMTGFLGFAMFNVYAMTGSLFLAIFLHFIIDVKFVFVPNKEKTEVAIS